MGALLVTAADVATYLNRDLSTINAERVELFIDLAGDLIRTELDQVLDYYADDVYVWDADGLGILLLPELPVDDVTEVEETRNGTTTLLVEDDDYDLELGDDGRLGIIRRHPRGAIWPLGTKVAVTYSHGYDLPEASGSPADQALPGAIRAAVFRVVSRGLANPTGLRQEQIGRYGYTAGGTDAGLYLTAGDKRDLDPFKPGNRGGAT